MRTRTSYTFLAVGCISLAVFTNSQAANIPLAWDAVTLRQDGSALTDLRGYRIFVSTTDFEQGGVFISTAQATADLNIAKILVSAPATTYTANLANGKRYFIRLTAFDSSGSQSAFNLDSNGNDVEVSTTVPDFPSITSDLQDQSLAQGAQAAFSVTATGTGPLSYRWQSRASISDTFTDIAGAANAASYTTAALTLSDTGSQFRVSVSNASGAVSSRIATLTVTSAPTAPSFTQSPASQTVSLGQTATFTVQLAGNTPITLQWQKRSSPTGTWSNLSGQTAASYTTNAVTLADNGSQYQCLASNAVQSNVASAIATLSVTQETLPPLDLSALRDRVFGLGQTIEFSYPYGDTHPVTYTWSFAAVSAGAAATGGLRILNYAGSTAATTAVPRFNLSGQGLTPGVYNLTVSVSALGQTRFDVARLTIAVSDLSALSVYPNPWRKDRHASFPRVTFVNLPANASIKIYTTSGRLVRDLGRATGQASWDLRTSSGDRVASGLYLYLITTEQNEKRRGKLGIIE